MALAISALVALPLFRAPQSQLGINIEHTGFIYVSYIMSGALVMTPMNPNPISINTLTLDSSFPGHGEF